MHGLHLRSPEVVKLVHGLHQEDPRVVELEVGLHHGCFDSDHGYLGVVKLVMGLHCGSPTVVKLEVGLHRGCHKREHKISPRPIYSHRRNAQKICAATANRLNATPSHSLHSNGLSHPNSNTTLLTFTHHFPPHHPSKNIPIHNSNKNQLTVIIITLKSLLTSHILI